MYYTTLKKLRDNNACDERYDFLKSMIEQTDDEPIPLLTILNINGLQDAIWALRTIEDNNDDIYRFALICARRVSRFIKYHERIEESLKRIDLFIDRKLKKEEIIYNVKTVFLSACNTPTYDIIANDAWNIRAAHNTKNAWYDINEMALMDDLTEKAARTASATRHTRDVGSWRAGRAGSDMSSFRAAWCNAREIENNYQIKIFKRIFCKEE